MSNVAPDPIAETLARLWSPLLVITTHHQGRDNGLVAVEARVVATLDGDELTIFLADVVSGGRHRSGEPLTLGILREHLPKEWLGEWATSREHQINEARRRRGIA